MTWAQLFKDAVVICVMYEKIGISSVNTQALRQKHRNKAEINLQNYRHIRKDRQMYISNMCCLKMFCFCLSLILLKMTISCLFIMFWDYIHSSDYTPTFSSHYFDCSVFSHSHISSLFPPPLLPFLPLCFLHLLTRSEIAV